MNLTELLQIAGVLHGGLIWAGLAMPKAIGLRAGLSVLPAFIRRLFWIYYLFIGFILVTFGLLTFIYADAMAAGMPVARGLAVVMAVFWLLRLAVAGVVLDVRPYLSNWFYRLGYYTLNTVFVYLAAVYTWAAFKGGAP